MNVVVIDDEKQARLSLVLLLKEFCPHVTVLSECENLSQGVKAIRKLQPDIVLLDIEMPGHSGLELLDFFDESEINFDIIFTTAYNEYAIRAFKFSAVDYLLKPIIPEELAQAVGRAERKKQKMENYRLLKQSVGNTQVGKIAVPSGSSLIFLATDQILFVKGDGAYSLVNMRDGVNHLVSRNLKNFEDILGGDPDFVRTHKSYIVNMAYVSAYCRTDGGSLLLNNHTSIPLSPEKAQLILDKIQLVKR